MKIKGINFSEKDYIMEIGTELDLNTISEKAYGTEYPDKSVTFKDGRAESEDGRIVIIYDTLAEVADKIAKGELSIDDFNFYGDLNEKDGGEVNFWMVQYVTQKAIYLDGKKI